MTNNSQRTLKLRTVTADNPLKVCFVCLGNICRSPTAEGVFEHLVKREGLLPYFEIDSAGTGAWHVGERANSRSRKVAEQNGVQLNSLARKFERSDLEEFDLVIAMDKEICTICASSMPEAPGTTACFCSANSTPYRETSRYPTPTTEEWMDLNWCLRWSCAAASICSIRSNHI